MIAELHRQRDAGKINNAEVQRVLDLPSSRVSEIFARKRRLQADEILKLIAHLGGKPAVAAETDEHEEEPGLVNIQHIDLAYGLGSTFTDDNVETALLRFPKIWVESITSSPPALLTWTRGRGDSMLPTIDDGDLILLDRSQRRVIEQDALWAFTVGETASIKRLRVKGDRFQILSDNPSVPADEEPIDFVNIVARVVFVGKRK